MSTESIESNSSTNLRKLGPLYHFLVSVQFLTRIPVPQNLNPTEDSLSKSLVWFPVVGAVLGIALFGLGFGLSAAGLDKDVCALIMIALGVCLTGAFHEDGFGDTIDGFYGGYTRPRRLEIMRDSRIGTFAALGLTILLLFRFTVFTKIDPQAWLVPLVLGFLNGRWAAIVHMKVLPYVREKEGQVGIVKPFVEMKGNTFWLATGFVGLLNLMALGLKDGLFLLGLLSVFCYLVAKYFRKKIGGMTGDTLGAINIFCEIVSLVYILQLGG